MDDWLVNHGRLDAGKNECVPLLTMGIFHTVHARPTHAYS